MERFKNEHIENLWGNLLPYIGGTCTAGEIADIVKLFEECAMAIEDEADDREHWRTMYGKTCKEVDMLNESISLRDRVIDKFRTTKTAVEKERDEYKSQLEDLYKFLGKWRNPKARDNFEDPQKLKDEIASLKESLDILKKSNEALLSANMDLAREKRKLEGSLSYTMIQQLEARVEELTAQLKDANDKADRCVKDVDDWASRAHYAEDTVVDLKKDYNKLFGENKMLNARLDCLRGGVKVYRNRYKEQSAKIQELQSRLKSMCNVKYGMYVRSRDTGYKNGQTDLWDKLQNVNDVKPWDIASFYPDLEDFLDAYKSWQEKKEQERIKHMRDHLIRFCMWRRCDGCPLHTDEFICGRGKGFCDMTYEELKKHYEKVGDCGWCPFKRKDD